MKLTKRQQTLVDIIANHLFEEQSTPVSIEDAQKTAHKMLKDAIRDGVRIEKKTRSMAIRLTHDDFVRVEEKARHSGLDKSSFARFMMLGNDAQGAGQ